MSAGVLQAWSLTASSNGSADANINFAEGQSPPSLNNSSRALMAAVKGWANQIGAAKTSGGSANAQTFTSDSVAAITAYAAGQMFVFRAGYTNTGATTFNVDGVGAKSIKKGGALAALAANDIVAGGIYIVAYQATGDCFVLLNPESGSVSSQPLDATLTAFAAQTTGADLIWYWTGTDAGTTMSLPSASRTQIAAGLGTAAVVADGTSGAVYGKLNANKTDSGNNTFSGTNTFSSSIHLSGLWWPVDASYNTPYIDLNTGYLNFNRKNTSDSYIDTFISMNLSSGVVSFGQRPLFNGNTALDTANVSSYALIPSNNLSDVSSASTARTNLGLNTMATQAASSVAITGGTITAANNLSSESSGTLTSASSNKIVVTTAGVTVNDGVHAANDQILIYNNSGSSVTVTQDTGMTLRLDGTSTTGNRTLGPRGKMHLFFNSNSEAICSGMGVT